MTSFSFFRQLYGARAEAVHEAICALQEDLKDGSFTVEQRELLGQLQSEILRGDLSEAAASVWIDLLADHDIPAFLAAACLERYSEGDSDGLAEATEGDEEEVPDNTPARALPSKHPSSPEGGHPAVTPAGGARPAA